MSTRGVVGYYKNGNLKVTFNHFDSYPSGLGESVKQYIFEKIKNFDMCKFEEKIYKKENKE